MKRNLSIQALCWLLLMVVAGSSCKKILEQTPKNAPYDEVYWKESRDYTFALSGNYSLLRDALTDKNNRYYMYGDAVAKNYFSIRYTGDGLEGIQNGDFLFKYNVTSLGDWTKFIKVITMSNLILYKLDKSTDADFADEENIPYFKNKIRGQALFLRAYTYFMMNRVWGDVPLVTEYYENPLTAPQLPRTASADIQKQIEKDCKEAAGLLDWMYTAKAERGVTASKGAVYALLTHLYLWRATTTNLASNTPIAADVNSADTTLTKLLAMGGYSYTDTANYYTTFIGRSNNVTSPEGIFQLYMDDRSQEGSSNHVGMEFLNNETISYYGGEPRFTVSATYLDNHYKYWWYNDVKLAWERKPDTLDVRYNKNFTKNKLGNDICKKYSNLVFRNPGQELEAFMSNDMILFRYADMRLLEAEIALYKDDLDKAITILNDNRKRNGTDMEYFTIDNSWTKDDLFWEYAAERGKELYLEGHIFYDLIRTRQYANFVDWLTESRFKAGGFYWPVSPLLFQQNKFLIQTKYWLGKI